MEHCMWGTAVNCQGKFSMTRLLNVMTIGNVSSTDELWILSM
jgi:hypothetical protein